MNHIKKQVSSRGFKSPIRLKSSIGLSRYKYDGLINATIDSRSEKVQTDPPDESTRVLRKILNKSPIHLLSPSNRSGGNSKSKSKAHVREASCFDAETEPKNCSDVPCKSSSTGLDAETVVESMSVTDKSKSSETKEKLNATCVVGSTDANISRSNGKRKSHTKDGVSLSVPECRSSGSGALPKSRLLPKENAASTDVIQTNKSTTSRTSKTSHKSKKKPDRRCAGSPRVVKENVATGVIQTKKSTTSRTSKTSRKSKKKPDPGSAGSPRIVEENVASTCVIQTKKSTTSRTSKTSRKSKKKPDPSSAESPCVVKSSRSKTERGNSVSRRNSRSGLYSGNSVISSTSSSYDRNKTIHCEGDDDSEDDIPFMEREVLFLSEQFVRAIGHNLNNLGFKTPGILRIDDRDDEVTDERVANNWSTWNGGAAKHGQDDAKRDSDKVTAYKVRVAAENSEDDEWIPPPVWHITEPVESGLSDCGSVARGTYMRDLRDSASREYVEDEATVISENIDEDELIHPSVLHFRTPP